LLKWKLNFSKNESLDFEKKIKPIIEVIDEPTSRTTALASQDDLTEKLDAILNMATSNEEKKENTDAVISEESNSEAKLDSERLVEDDDFELLD